MRGRRHFVRTKVLVMKDWDAVDRTDELMRRKEEHEAAFEGRSTFSTGVAELMLWWVFRHAFASQVHATT